MKVLLIEDNENLVDLLLKEFAVIRPQISVTVANSRESAFNCLESSVFDFIICDLHLPTEDGALDHDVEHGNTLTAYIVNDILGTPLLILSGFAELEMMEELIRSAKQADLFGDMNSIPMLQYLSKDKLHECIDCVTEYSRKIQGLDDIVLVGSGSGSLLPNDARIMRVFARRLSGAMFEVRQLTGGLSGGRTYLLDVFDSQHRQRAFAVAKINLISEVIEERERVRRFVAPMLKSGSFAHHIDIVDAGAGRIGGLFDARAQDFIRTLFDLIAEDPDNAANIVTAIRNIQDPWISNSTYNTFTIQRVREWFVSDESPFEKLAPTIEWEPFEARNIPCRVGIQHGDLHPGNILVNSSMEPLLIDFARSSDDVSLIVDPLTLEFSLLFHPAAQYILGDWPSLDAIFRWPETDLYIDQCPIPDFILACRRWAEEVCTSQREILAVAYGYAARQLRFEDVDLDLASAIIHTAIERFNQ